MHISPTLGSPSTPAAAGSRPPEKKRIQQMRKQKPAPKVMNPLADSKIWKKNLSVLWKSFKKFCTKPSIPVISEKK